MQRLLNIFRYRYCNEYAGSVSRWKFITVKLNTQLLITVSNFSRIPAHVQLILGLQPMRVTSSNFSPLLTQTLIIILEHTDQKLSS
jgi:hypothetical protein